MTSVMNSMDLGLGTRKTLVIMVTVIGCIAFLWPKIFYPMMAPNPKPLIKDHRGSGCCNVVLGSATFANTTENLEKTYRKSIKNILTGEISIRQERPPHLRPDLIHPAMRERGRNIPASLTVPVIPVVPVIPRIVEGRPGPIPGMRPPMGGSVHQATPKANTMGFLMPLYTIAIVSFFVYTIMKLVFKKPNISLPYGPIQPDPVFQKKVFGQEHQHQLKRPDDGKTKLVVTAIQGLIDAADEQMKRRNATNISKDTQQNGNAIETVSNGHAKIMNENNNNNNTKNGDLKILKQEHLSLGNGKMEHKEKGDNYHHGEQQDKGTVHVLGLETTTSCEGGQKWGRPSPSSLSSKSNHTLEDHPKPQSIYLEGCLPHESQILVSNSELTTESIIDDNLDDDTLNEPAVVLSSKMTLSLISLDPIDNKNENETDDGTEAEIEDLEVDLEDDLEEEVVEESEEEEIVEVDENKVDEPEQKHKQVVS